MSSGHKRVSDILVVGGSLAGLMTGLALSRHGLSVTLLERSTDTDRTGAALQLLGRHLVVCGDEHDGNGGA